MCARPDKKTTPSVPDTNTRGEDPSAAPRPRRLTKQRVWLGDPSLPPSRASENPERVSRLPPTESTMFGEVLRSFPAVAVASLVAVEIRLSEERRERVRPPTSPRKRSRRKGWSRQDACYGTGRRTGARKRRGGQRSKASSKTERLFTDPLSRRTKQRASQMDSSARPRPTREKLLDLPRRVAPRENMAGRAQRVVLGQRGDGRELARDPALDIECSAPPGFGLVAMVQLHFQLEMKIISVPI